MLQATDEFGKNLPWSRLVCDDLRVLRNALPRNLETMGDPSTHPNEWFDLMCNFSNEWRDIVDCYHTSYDDQQVASSIPASSHVRACQFVCAQCDGVAFETSKQLLAHQRAKHGLRNPIVYLVGDFSICPICGTDFRSRIRLIAHLSETRIRSKYMPSNCRHEFLARAPKTLDPAVTERLNKIDRAARHVAVKQGRSHVIATIPAKLSAKCKEAKAGRGVRKRIVGKTPVSRLPSFYRKLQMELR